MSYEDSFIKHFSFGFFFGLGFLLIYLSWINNPFLFFETTKPYALLSIFLPVFLSIFFGFGFCLYRYFKNPILLILITPLIFIFIEFLISNFLYGFPWITNSLILSNNYLGFFIIKYYGTLTSGYLIISIFLLPALIIFKEKITYFRKIIVLIYAPLICFLIIPTISNTTDNNFDKKLNIEANQILNPIKNKNNEQIENNIIELINNSKSDLIVFAENNFPYLVDKKNLDEINILSKENQKVIIGATTSKEGNFYNTFLLFENDHTHFFDKKILVPFGEFLPFRKLLKFMEVISGSADFKKGNVERIITTKDNIKILPIICYEVIFDQIFNIINSENIDIMINITNDSWFGNKIGPYQHFYISRIKSLIANKPLLRVSNNGISALIDNNGKILRLSKLNKASSFRYVLKIHNSKNYIYYHILFSCYLLFIFFLLLIFRKKFQNEK